MILDNLRDDIPVFYVHIKFSQRHIGKGDKPQKSNSQGKDTKQSHTKKHQEHKEKLHFVTIHHLLAFVNGIQWADVWVISNNIESHGIGKGRNDSGYYQQKHP